MLMSRWWCRIFCAGARNHSGSTPSSATRFNTPFDPMMAVFTAPARISVPTSTTNPWNISFSTTRARQETSTIRRSDYPDTSRARRSGISITAKKRDERREQHAVQKDHVPARSRFFSLGCAISRYTCASVSNPLIASIEWPRPTRIAMSVIVRRNVPFNQPRASGP